jgi:hypothetical protein
MLSWIIQISIISIILIFLVHYLFNFFKETLTVPKIKDLVNVPNKKYENMYNIISKNNESNEPANYTDIDLLPNQAQRHLEEKVEPKWDKTTDADSMKSELKSFLKKQLKESSTDISSLSSMPNSSSYSYSDY